MRVPRRDTGRGRETILSFGVALAQAYRLNVYALNKCSCYVLY